MANTKKPQKDTQEVAIVKSNRADRLPQSDAQLDLKPGDNNRFAQKNLELFRLPKVDLMNNEAVLSRIDEYFAIMAKYDSKPTVTGLAMALGIDRRRLWEIKTQNFGNVTGKYTQLPEEVVETIRKTYDYLEIMWEDYMLNGKINPVSGIFLGKNNFGYQDKTEYVLTPNSQKEEFDAESIRKRYLIEAAEDETPDTPPEE
jgi:hypothetical protein|nr:MAG TPA: Terminase small subunit [Caudoviricetes sp.]